MKTITWTDAKSVEQAIQDGSAEQVIVLRDGKPVAMVVPFDEDDLARFARESDPEFVRSIVRAREQVRQGKAISLESLRAELGE